MKTEPRTAALCKTLALLAVALTAAACQSELSQSDETSPLQPTGEKVTLTICATQGSTDSSDNSNTPQTRTEYEDGLTENGSTGSVFVKWEGGTAPNATVETINVIGFVNNATGLSNASETLTSLPATLSSDGKSITFTGDVTKADNYAAFYFGTNTWKWGNDRFTLSFLGQKQDCTEGKDMAHLKNYNIMMGTSVAGSNSVFTFEHQTPMLRFDLTLPALATVSKVTLSTTLEDGIYTGYFIKLNDGRFSCDATTYAESISLDITNHDGTDKLKAYMIADISRREEQTFTITAETDKVSYRGTLTIPQADGSLEPGSCYTLKSTLKETSFSDHTMASKTLEGEGSEADPYLIKTPGDLKYLVEKTTFVTTDYYRLETDIHVEASIWKPIGRFPVFSPPNNPPNSAFQSHFDGNGHRITGKLMGNEIVRFGFFGYVDNATITNLHMDATVYNSKPLTGSVVGSAKNSTLINCSNTGTVTMKETNTNNKDVGGIVGSMWNSTAIACFNTGAVNSTGGHVGGIVGNSNVNPNTFNDSNIIACFNTGTVTAALTIAGGISGNTRRTTVAACYSTGVVKSNAPFGGILGVISKDANDIAIAIATSCRWVGDVVYAIGGTTNNGTNIKDPNIATLNSTGVSALNEAIKKWNTDNVDDATKQCAYHFEVGSSVSPIIVSGAPQ